MVSIAIASQLPNSVRQEKNLVTANPCISHNNVLVALRVGFENCVMDVNRSRISPTRINVCVRANRWKTNFRTIDLSVRTSNGLVGS